MDKKLLRQLHLIDWDFISNDETTAGGIHWYPGSFVPGMPGALIEALSQEGDVVFDPYGGIGTTGIAALARGRRAVCTDVHPIAVASSYVAQGLIFLRLSDEDAFNALYDTLNAVVLGGTGHQPSLLSTVGGLRGIDKFINDIASPAPARISSIVTKGAPNVAALKPWYSHRTLKDLLELHQNLGEIKGSAFIRLIALVLISAVCRPLSSQTSSWGHIADNVLPKEKEDKVVKRAADLWLRRTFGRIASLKVAQGKKLKSPAFSVACLDWMNGSATLAAPKAQLLVTSPPYAGAIDYTLAQRLSFYALGWSDEDISALCKQELGARRRRFRENSMTLWAEQLVEAAKKQFAYLADDALAVFVLPHKDSGRDLGAELLKGYLDHAGWQLNFEKDRSIRQARTRQSWTSIKRETILLFARKA